MRLKLEEFINSEEDQKCKGLYWKCEVNAFCVGESKMT